MILFVIYLFVLILYPLASCLATAVAVITKVKAETMAVMVLPLLLPLVIAVAAATADRIDAKCIRVFLLSEPGSEPEEPSPCRQSHSLSSAEESLIARSGQDSSAR